ncbi:MAG: Lrp/AsnC family transcriptional regulator [Candidatus Thermoplasmatota archaeon]|nr:Lrp/AsnC family transcriptional regulator [Candidatus Thermoplasmatota archaeon]MBU1940877.1 Lrp/AsnC family transcriptional regulator [Candidatus Thermoplasmatota archaeon]
MPKNSRKQIDQDEKKIIAYLQRNAKESIDTIAKKCSFSRQKVWRIIKRLEKTKTIWGYHAVIDDDKVNRHSYIMLIKRSNEPMANSTDKIINQTMEKRGAEINVDVECSKLLHGIYDWFVCFTAPDIREAKKFSEIFNREYPNLISEIHILENIFTVKNSGVINPNITQLKDYF